MSQSKGNSHLGQAGKFPAIEARFLGRTAPASLPQGETTENQETSKTENAPESSRSDEQGGEGIQDPLEAGSAAGAGEILEETADQADLERLVVTDLWGNPLKTPLTKAADQVSEVSLGEFYKLLSDVLIALEKKIANGTASAKERHRYERWEQWDREQRQLYQEKILEIWTGQNEHELTKPERDILKALGDDTMKGGKLLKKAGYESDWGYYKKTLSDMVKRGILRKDKKKGYHKGEIEVRSREGKTYYYKKNLS